MASRSIRGTALAAVLLASACGDDGAASDGGPADAGDAGAVDAGPGDAGPLVHSAPMGPTFGPCPTGFRDVPLPGVGNGQRFCDPWPEGGRIECPDGEMHLPGEPGCEPVAPPCPADGFPEGLPDDGSVVFVRAGAVAGDGSRATPFGALADGVAAVPLGGIVAIAPGLYEGSITTTRPMTLWGGCLDAVLRGATYVINARSDLELRSLHLEGVSAIFIAPAGEIHGRDLLIVGAVDGVIYVNGYGVELEHSSLRRNGASAFIGTGGARVVLRRVEMRDVGDTPFRLTDSSLEAERLAVHGVSGDDPIATLLTFEGTSTARFSQSVLSDLESTSAFVLDQSQLTMTDTVVSTVADAVPRDTDSGLLALGTTSITFERVVLVRPTLQAVAASGPSASLTLRDVVVAGIVPGGELGRGQFLEVSVGASAVLERVHVVSAVGFGLFAVGAGADVVATDLRIVDTLPSLDGTSGRAIQVQSGATLDATRVLVDGGREAGVVVAGPTTMATLRDVEVSRIREAACTPGPTCVSAGIGIGVYYSAHVSAERFLLDENALLGAQIALEGELDLMDGVVRGHPVGVNVQVPGYDVTRLMSAVSYIDNLVNLDSSDLPVPAVSP